MLRHYLSCCGVQDHKVHLDHDDMSRLGELNAAGREESQSFSNQCRLLQERAAAGNDLSDIQRALWRILDTDKDVTRKLRMLWALHVTGGLTEEALVKPRTGWPFSS